MYFVECEEIEPRGKNRTPKQSVSKLICDFANAGIKYAQIKDIEYKNIDIGHRSFSNIIRRLKMFHIKIVVRGGELYLVNTLIK